MHKQIDVVPSKRLTEEAVADNTPDLVVHLQARHGWSVAFRGWRHDDLSALHGAEHDESAVPQIGLTPHGPEFPTAA